MFKILDIKYNFGEWFIFIGLIIQCLVFRLNNETVLSLISGLSGVISVVLCSQKKLSFYFWSFLQLITFIILAYQHQLYGKILENIFYGITMIFGVIIWNNNSKNGEVKPKSMQINDWLIVSIHLILGIICLYFLLNEVNGSQPLLDATTTVLAIVAQLLMIFRYKEQWIFWFILDILCVIIWIIENNWCMVMQYIFWTTNCIYGYYMWNKNNL